MADTTSYSIGIDIGQNPSPAALARGDGVELLAPTTDPAALVESLIAREGITPTAVVLASPLDRRADLDSLAGDVARRCRLAIDSVGLTDRLDVEQVGLAHLRSQNTGPGDISTGEPGTGEPGRGEPGTGVVDASFAAAVGAALLGCMPPDRRRVGGWLAVGAGGAIVGGLGSALSADSVAAIPAVLGPAGVPLTQGVAAGAPGVPFASLIASGPAGVSLGQTFAAGPSGVPIGGGTNVGPAGVPINAGAGAGPAGVQLGAVAKPAGRGRPALIAAVVVAVIAVGVGVVASSGNDAPTPAAAATTERVATPSAPAVIASPDTTPDTTPAANTATSLAPSTPNTAPVEIVGAGCAAGSWLADNQAFGESFTSFSAAGGGPIMLDEVSGAIHVDIAGDGAVITTYEDFTVIATVEGLTSEVFVTGVDKNQIDFADDGSYVVTSAEIGSTQRVSADGVVFMDGPSPEASFVGSSTFTCTGDRLDVTMAGPLGDWVAIFARDA